MINRRTASPPIMLVVYENVHAVDDDGKDNAYYGHAGVEVDDATPCLTSEDHMLRMTSLSHIDFE